ncbi:MAG: hypothetical protein ACLFMX_03785 [Halobacteriales archaeon]
MPSREVRLNELRSVLAEVSYPISRASAIDQFGDVVLDYADGAEALADVLERCPSERFEALDDLEADVFANLPTEAVGEPGQSEGDA